MFESLLTGGLTGVFGAIFTQIADFFKRKQELKHEVELRRLDIEIMDKEWEYRNRQAAVEGEVEMAKSADRLFEASYSADSARYCDPSKLSSASAMLLVFVDVVRGLIRPALTIYLIWLVADTRSEINTIIKNAGGMTALDMSQAFTIYNSTIEMVLYLAATCVAWWFGTRSTLSNGGKK